LKLLDGQLESGEMSPEMIEFIALALHLKRELFKSGKRFGIEAAHQTILELEAAVNRGRAPQ